METLEHRKHYIIKPIKTTFTRILTLSYNIIQSGPGELSIHLQHKHFHILHLFVIDMKGYSFDAGLFLLLR